MALLAPPDECLVELMRAENERQGRQGHVIPAFVHVADDVDPDGADGEPADQVGLRREAHWRDLTAHAEGAAVSRTAVHRFVMVSGGPALPRPSGGAERSSAELSERSMTAWATSLSGNALLRE